MTHCRHAVPMDIFENMRIAQERAARGGAMDRDALRAMRLSQTRAARWMGISTRTSQRYALGETEVPRVVALLLRTKVKAGWTACQWEFRKPGWQVPRR
jgi:hypothetical protein